MKKLLILIFASFTFTPVVAQIQDGMNQNLMLITTKESDRMKGLEGSPYLDEEFKYGTVAVKGKEPLKVFMRYNVYQDQVEIKTNVQSEDTYLLPKRESTVYNIGSEIFVLDQVTYNGQRIEGYFIEHYDGAKWRLLEKPVATVSEAVKARTGYDQDKPARIKIEEEFYVVNKDGEVHNVRVKHRDIKKSFNSDSAKQYLDDNKIRSEQDLIDFVSYLDKQ